MRFSYWLAFYTILFLVPNYAVCAPASLYQQEAGKKLEERIDVEAKLEDMDRKLDRLLEAIQPTQPGRRATGRAQEVEDSEWIELFRFCECEDDPNSRLDVDDEDDNLEPIEERELRKGKKLLPQDGASRLADISNLKVFFGNLHSHCLLYTSPSPRD